MASAFLQPPAHFEPGDNPQQAWDDWKEAYNIYEQALYKNVIQASAVFNTMKQKENQTFDEFVTDLRRQAEKCDFWEKKDRLIGDRIVVGIRDAALRERLFRERDLTLVQIITTCKAAEISKKHVKELQEPNFEVQALQKPKQWNSQKPATMENRQQKPQLKLQQKRSRCGTTHRPRECPAYGCNCYHCGKFGHFASLCRQRQRGSSTSRQRIGLLEDPQSLDLHNINCNSEWTETVNVNGHNVSFKLDTGSDVNIMPKNQLSAWSSQPAFKPTAARVTTYTGQQLPIDAECELRCSTKEKECTMKFLVVSQPLKPILGANACEALNLVTRRQPQQTTVAACTATQRLENVLNDFPDVFEGMGKLPGVYSIQLKEGVTPTVSAPRRVPSALEHKVKEELQRMQQNGIIAEITEPSEWVHPIVIITKKDGSVRLCLDPRNLNKAIKRQHYQVPVAEELFANLSGAKIFSVLDAKSAFYQLVLDEASSRLCTFTTPWGRYRFLRVPFGIATAPELFQQAIDRVFERQLTVKPYFDDVLVASRNFEEHEKDLRNVLTVARANNLKLNKAKLQLGLTDILTGLVTPVADGC
ncbi:uncharacterized protein K02A2.6-like [Rhipicephalus sanguineus]|uniref:uncharacterized protein K02A2.6-like n=1 Tax=Rhipicephalus sanguineus TaxID=34632 RepID=UPI00189508DB|nr:uncharacterized protein K02A2.6-like [Rhipicephalus sanguineus]